MRQEKTQERLGKYYIFIINQLAEKQRI